LTVGFRLVNGRLPTEGQLESFETLYYERRRYFTSWSWLPYSADSFDDHDAGVACLTLGFRYESRLQPSITKY